MLLAVNGHFAVLAIEGKAESSAIAKDEEERVLPFTI